MTLSALLDYARKYVLRDTSVPPLWRDEVVVQRLNDAQRKVAVRVHAFVEDDWEIALYAGEANYPLDPATKFVYTVRLDGYPSRLTRSTESWTPDDGISTRPTRYTIDRKTRSIRFYPTPDDDYLAILRVARLPVDMSLDALDAEIELPDEYQLMLVDWAAYLCFSDDDADGRNDLAADRALKRYQERVSTYLHDEYHARTGQLAHVRGNRVK